MAKKKKSNVLCFMVTWDSAFYSKDYFRTKQAAVKHVFTYNRKEENGQTTKVSRVGVGGLRYSVLTYFKGKLVHCDMISISPICES